MRHILIICVTINLNFHINILPGSAAICLVSDKKRIMLKVLINIYSLKLPSDTEIVRRPAVSDSNSFTSSLPSLPPGLTIGKTIGSQ